MPNNYDFSGWATKADMMCSDGVIIKGEAFKHMDGAKVPLVWQHDYTNIENVLGHVILKHSNGGIYCYGYFNDTEQGRSAKDRVLHRDVNSLSIAANKIKKIGHDVVHGVIREVSLVLAGANPGALIDEVVEHDSSEGMSAIIYNDSIIITPDDELIEHSENKDTKNEDSEEHNLKQLVKELDISEELLEKISNLSDKDLEKLIKYIDDNLEENYSLSELIEKYFNKEEKDMTRNVFKNQNEDVKHSSITKEDLNLISSEMKNKGSLQQSIKDFELTHGISNISVLFPETTTLAEEPKVLTDPYAITGVLDKVRKSPFSRVRVRLANLSESELRARGYITGNQKKSDMIKVLSRSVDPTTVYVKDDIDRDDIIDITDFDVVRFMQKVMENRLKDTLSEAILFGDSRDITDSDKINEDKLIPIIKDSDMFVVSHHFESEPTPIEFIKQLDTIKLKYRGSGNLTAYINPKVYMDIKYATSKADGKLLFNSILTDEQIKAYLGVREIVQTPKVSGILAVDLRDYQIGTTKGGEITSFDDFDIDFNRYKYLIETRLSGMLTVPKSALLITIKNKTGADPLTSNYRMSENKADRVVTNKETGDYGNRKYEAVDPAEKH